MPLDMHVLQTTLSSLLVAFCRSTRYAQLREGGPPTYFLPGLSSRVTQCILFVQCTLLGIRSLNNSIIASCSKKIDI
jgi:hypothetical protein